MKTVSSLIAAAAICLGLVSAPGPAKAWGNKIDWQCYYGGCGTATRYAYPNYPRVYGRYRHYWQTYPRYYWQGYPTYGRRYVKHRYAYRR